MPHYETVTLAQAWHHWWTVGQLDSETTLLWGHRLLWWARAGKVAQAVGGLTIIAEIIGAERLRAFGNSMHETLTLEKAKERSLFYLNSLMITSLVINSRFTKYYRDVPKSVKLQIKINSFTSSLIIALFLWLLLKERHFVIPNDPLDQYLINHSDWYEAFAHRRDATRTQFLQTGWGQIFICIFAFFVANEFLSPVYAVFIGFLMILFGIVTDALLIEPIAWVLERPRFDRWLKILALLLLLIGFHFDFLAS